MPIIATPLNDPALGEERVTLTREGVRIERFWSVNTRDPLRALTALGLPAIGTAAGPAHPDVTLVSLTSRPWGGQDSGTAEPTGGRTIFEGIFESPQMRGSLVRPTPGLKLTEITAATSTVTARFDRRAPDPNPFLNLPIAGGDGASRVVGTTTARVRAWHGPAASIDWTRLIRYAQNNFVNAELVSLPPLFGTPQVFTAQPGELRYESFEVQVQAGPPQGGAPQQVIGITHVLAWAPDHRFRWVEEDDKGQARGGVIESELYTPAPFAGLF